MLGRGFRATLLLLSLILALAMVVFAATGPSIVVGAIAVGAALTALVMLTRQLVSRSLRREWPAIASAMLASVGLAAMGSVALVMSDTFGDGGVVDRICGAGGLFGQCQDVVQSRWSALHLGFGTHVWRIPYVVLGLLFYSTLLVWFLIVGRPAPERRCQYLPPLVLTAAGSGMGVFLSVIMFVKLGGPCPFCLTAHLATLCLFVVTGVCWLRDRPERSTTGASEGMTMRSAARPVAAVAVAVVFGLAGLQFRQWSLSRQQVVDWQVRPDDSVLGPASAPFVVIVYSDFQCAYCRDFAKQLDRVRSRYPEQIRLIYRHYPLNRACNELTPVTTHALSCHAAWAAEAARGVGGNEAFWKMHDALFDHQAELGREPYDKLAEQVGLDPQRFSAAMDDPAIRQRIDSQVLSAKRFHVIGTPAAFLNGRRVRRWRSMEFWDALIRESSDASHSKATASGVVPSCPVTPAIGTDSPDRVRPAQLVAASPLP